MSGFLNGAASLFGRSLNFLAGQILNVRTPLLIVGAAYSTGAVFRHHFLDWAISSGPSMYPTLPDQEHAVILDMRCRYGRNVKVGDIIQASHPQIPNRLVGKRVLGVAGDYVVHRHSAAAQDGEEPQMYQIPEGHVWVEGDNLAWSRDSRVYGAMPMSLIRSREVAYKDGLFFWRWLRPGRGLRKVEDWELAGVLGEE